MALALGRKSPVSDVAYILDDCGLDGVVQFGVTACVLGSEVDK